jgi:hypothetical protein
MPPTTPPIAPLTSGQTYQVNDDDQRRQLNRSLFRRLYLADGHITNHELRSTTP